MQSAERDHVSCDNHCNNDETERRAEKILYCFFLFYTLVNRVKTDKPIVTADRRINLVLLKQNTELTLDLIITLIHEIKHNTDQV